MSKESKRMKSARYASQYQDLFACPVCQSPMTVLEFTRLSCSNHHTFDFAKQGYINLTTNSVNSKYGKDLFEARRKVIQEGSFFNPLRDAITEIILHHRGVKESISILDTGCGEGSHLSNICDRISSDTEKRVVGVGIDLSKEGIMVAAKHDNQKIWAVADLANIPFKDKQFDVILNILSPSNYAEFKRVMKTNGIVIKVVPKRDYLKELREHFFQQTEKQSYSNAETVERFQENFPNVERSSLSYTMNLNQSMIQSLVHMTPLTWATTEESVTSFLNKESVSITVDLEILIGKHII